VRGVGVIAGTDPVTDAVDRLLGLLDGYSPPGGGGAPAGSVALVEMTHRPVLLDGPATVPGRVVQIEARARFQLWFSDVSDSDTGVNQLTSALLADRDRLRGEGVLRLRGTGAGALEEIAGAGFWGRGVDVEVLFEHAYVDSDEALGLIATIPVAADPEHFTVTRNLTRWDDLSTPDLAVRGPITLSAVSLLVHAGHPGGPVRLLRTVDGGPAPVPIPTVPGFLVAIGGPEPARHSASCTLPDLAALEAAMTPAGPGGPAVRLGDPPVAYQSLTLTIDPPLRLATGRDRFEISYPAGVLDPLDVAYLSAH
jgi:hypothetical protein